MKTYKINIKAGFAQRNKLPTAFLGKVLVKTQRAVYVYGHGSREALQTGRCCACGRELTHPVSITLGIGPICGEHFWDWDLVGGFSEENVERLKKEIGSLMESMKVDTWMPRSVIISAEETDAEIQIPSAHPMLEKKETKPEIKKEARMIRFGNDGTGSYGIKITFPYNPNDVLKVKTLEDRRFQSVEKYWTAALTAKNIEDLKEWGWEIDPKLIEWMSKSKVNVEEIQDDLEIPGLKMELFPFQKRGVAFIEKKEGNALIADEMELGKTAQALAWLQLHPEIRRTVIVVPASLKLNWKREAEMWLDGDRIIQILSGKDPERIYGQILIINYDVLSSWLSTLLGFDPQLVIADEVHYAKNNKAIRTKALKKLAQQVPHFLGLSGTPIVNRPVEFLNAIKLVDSTLFPNNWHYLKRYCGAYQTRYGWDLSGAHHTEELHEILTNSIMIRRKKADVLKDLPDKIRSFIPMELDNTTDYRSAEFNFIDFVKERKGATAAARASNAETLAKIEALKQLAVEGKLNQAIAWIKEFLEVEGKLVVFAVHKAVIDRLMIEFKNFAVKVDGSVTGPNRQLAVDTFQNDPKIQLFVGNIKAAGVGITLTASSNVAFLELPWTPGDLSQAEDRCHRIGQKDAVNIHYLLAQGTIEEDIAELLDKKRKVLDSVLDGEIPEQDSLLLSIMNKYEKS